jgi:hypothetical protein
MIQKHMLECNVSAMAAHRMLFIQETTGAQRKLLLPLQDNDITTEPVRLGRIATYIAEDQQSSLNDVSQAVHLMLLNFRLCPEASCSAAVLNMCKLLLCFSALCCSVLCCHHACYSPTKRCKQSAASNEISCASC